MESELKPCSVCGTEATARVNVYGRTGVQCTAVHCVMHDDWMDIHAWNSRPIEDALRAELAAAQTRIAKLERLREAAQAIDAAFGTSDSLAACGELLDALHAVD